MNSPIQDVNLFAPLTTYADALAGRVAVGALLGLTWGASLRAWMAVLALTLGEQPHVTWTGTFGGVLLPAALMGAALGGAYAAEPSVKVQGWALLSPLLLILGPVIFTKDFLPKLLTTGVGGGAIGVALIGLLGAYALSGFGPLWTRLLSSLAVSSLLAGALGYGIYQTAKGSAEGAFGALLFVLLMAVLIAGVSAPARYGVGGAQRQACCSSPADMLCDQSRATFLLRASRDGYARRSFRPAHRQPTVLLAPPSTSLVSSRHLGAGRGAIGC